LVPDLKLEVFVVEKEKKTVVVKLRVRNGWIVLVQRACTFLPLNTRKPWFPQKCLRLFVLDHWEHGPEAY
jgi:hypothetical protein